MSSLCPLSLLAARRPIYHRPSSLWSETYGEHYPSAPHIPHFPTLLCLADVTFKRGPFVSHKYITNGLTRKKYIKKTNTHTWHFRPSTGPRSSVNSCPKVKSMSKFLKVVTVLIFILPEFASCSICLLGFRMQTTFLNA